MINATWSPRYGGDPVKEYEQFFKLGVDGLFTDFAVTARPVADRLFGSNTPEVLAGRGTIGGAGEHGHAAAAAVRDASMRRCISRRFDKDS